MIVTNCLDEYFSLMDSRPELFSTLEGYQIVTDRKIIEKYQELNNVKIGVIYKSKFNMLVVDLIASGSEFYTYERIVPAAIGKAVVAIPVFKGKLILLKQNRHPIRSTQLCFPRGFGEDGVSPVENAKKELFEEIGAKTNNCEFLGTIFPDSGLCSTECYVFLCEIENYNRASFSEGITDLMCLTPPELSEKIKNNIITDSFTLSAFALLKAKHGTNGFGV